MDEIILYDTTLRDGTQREGISLSVEDKIKITKKLDLLGIHYIEGGWPGSNPKDLEFFQRIKEIKFLNAQITAFGSTCRPGVSAEDDKNLHSLVESKVKTVTIFGKSWDFHVEAALQTTLKENLRLIQDSIRFLRDQGLKVFYDAEHFFDGYKCNPSYAVETLQAAAAAGAEWIILCDTNGGCLSFEISEIVEAVKKEVKCPLGIHVHNDGDLAVANTLTAVKAGVRQVQGTINGWGERCGNADLCSVIPNLQVKMGKKCIPPDKLVKLTEVSHYVNEIANLVHRSDQPFVGRSAFAHKGGVHVSAIIKHPRTYEHLQPELVGNERRVLISELGGLSNFMYRAKELGLEIDQNRPKAKELIKQIKQLEHEGFQFEGADASLELLLNRAFNTRCQEFFILENFKVYVEKQTEEGSASEAVIKIRVKDQTVHTAAEGNGPVNALDNALRKALLEFYPSLKDMHLTDYKVRVLDEKEGTGAKVRVMIESADANSAWSTVGLSENIIDASWQALTDSMRYALLQDIKRKKKEKEKTHHG